LEEVGVELVAIWWVQCHVSPAELLYFVPDSTKANSDFSSI
jgi:hypothetical protein